MTCFHPLQGYYSAKVNASGKRSIVFDHSKSIGSGVPVTLPCGRCIGCRLERSRQWAIRISHEASLYDKNCFITLTYKPEKLPDDGSLNVRHFQLFMKKLRKKYGQKIRFFHCGEYGENLGRPHYHACLLNHDFPDKVLHRITERGDHIYRSPALEELWPDGFSEIGSVTFDSAAYAARYITKKITGDPADDHYQGKKPEYTTMSRRPGIGVPWLEKYKTDVFPHDYIVARGKKLPVPRFYNQRYEMEAPEKYEKIKRKRLLKAAAQKRANPLEHERERLQVKEIVQLRTIESLKRKIEMT